MITLGPGLVLPEDVAKTIEQHPKSTIEPTSAAMDPRVRAELSELSKAPSPERVEIGDTLGEGGMGIVRLGEQKSLGRAVAVKTLKAVAVDDAAVLRLLREGWITGALEHPNIVPVYDLSVDERGAPVLVLKKIDGTAWSELLQNPTQIIALFGSPDVLEANLRIVLQLCRALEFAHSRGVIHRDVKPENVMIGEFGEVYLLDWGIAVSLHSDERGRLPSIHDTHGLAGTLPYMAPEMLEEPPRLSQQTDIYLLGATLYELITGAPPHTGANVMAVVHHVLLGAIDFEQIKDEDLRAICRSALHPDPAQRFGSVSLFREQIERYLRYREPRALFAQARESAAKLSQLCGTVTKDNPGSRNTIYDLYAGCRFALQRVLRSGLDTAHPQAVLDQVYTQMIEYELSVGDPGAAERIVAEWPAAPVLLRSRVEAAQAQAIKRLSALQLLEHEQNPSVGGLRRWWSGFAIGMTWVILPLGTIYPGETWNALHGIPFLQVLIISIFSLRSRKHGVANQHNLHLIRHAASTMIAQFVLTVALRRLGLEPAQAFVLLMLLWGFGTALVAVWVHALYWLAVAAFAVAFSTSLYNIYARGIAASLANATLLGVVLFLWHPKTQHKLTAKD